jgi:hypothetical protein
MRTLTRVSQRFFCWVVFQHHKNHRHDVLVVDIEEAKVKRQLRKIAADHIRCRRRMDVGLLDRRDGW